jgi:hypothetical protein
MFERVHEMDVASTPVFLITPDPAIVEGVLSLAGAVRESGISDPSERPHQTR